MRDTSTSTIAQLLYTRPLPLDFDLLVEEMNAALAQCDVTTRSLVRQDGNVAIFDLDRSRVVLSLALRPGGGHSACLSASVGPAPKGNGSGEILRKGAAMCRMIVERLQARFPADAVAWHTLPGAITSERLDALIAQIPTARELEPLSKAEMRFPPLAPVNASDIANDVPDVPKRHSGNETVRSALYPDGPPWQSGPRPANVNATPMRLAIHTMNATLILVSLPVGAAMLTYSLLRGEDLRMTSHVMVLTGLGAAFLHSNLGQSVLASI